jgi:hypothetical protein
MALRARDLQKKAVALSCNQQAGIQKGVKQGHPLYFRFKANYLSRVWEIFLNELSTAVHVNFMIRS